MEVDTISKPQKYYIFSEIIECFSLMNQSFAVGLMVSIKYQPRITKIFLNQNKVLFIVLFNKFDNQKIAKKEAESKRAEAPEIRQLRLSL